LCAVKVLRWSLHQMTSRIKIYPEDESVISG
jgi:hypothetical protein